MKTPIPIKRHPALVSFSKDHHFGLLLTWKIRQGFKNDISPERIADYVLFFFKADLEKHFTEEEDLLFSQLPAGDALRQKGEADHHALRQLIALISEHKGDAALLNQFADKLQTHIRFEERQLFNHLQERIGPDQLALIAKQFSNDGKRKDENWTDTFWEKNNAIH